MKQEVKEMLRNKAEDIRKKLGYDLEAPIDFSNLYLLLPNITLLEYPLSQNVRGAILKNSMDVAIIVLNTHQELHRFYFSYCHELYHLFFGDIESRACPIESIETRDEEEKCADIFAEYLILPRNGFINFFHNNCESRVNSETILKIGNYYHVHFSLVIKRLLGEGLIKEHQFNGLLTDTIIEFVLSKYGLSDDLYMFRRNDDEIVAFGKYISLAYSLFEKGRIGESKLEELLADINKEAIVEY